MSCLIVFMRSFCLNCVLICPIVPLYSLSVIFFLFPVVLPPFFCLRVLFLSLSRRPPVVILPSSYLHPVFLLSNSCGLSIVHLFPLCHFLLVLRRSHIVLSTSCCIPIVFLSSSSHFLIILLLFSCRFPVIFLWSSPNLTDFYCLSVVFLSNSCLLFFIWLLSSCSLLSVFVVFRSSSSYHTSVILYVVFLSFSSHRLFFLLSSFYHFSSFSCRSFDFQPYFCSFTVVFQSSSIHRLLFLCHFPIVFLSSFCRLPVVLLTTFWCFPIAFLSSFCRIPNVLLSFSHCCSLIVLLSSIRLLVVFSYLPDAIVSFSCRISIISP